MNLRSLYEKLNWLSIDVVLGAVCSYRMATLLPAGQGQIHWPTAMVLASVVFMIYVLDRLLDNSAGVQATARHQFQYQYKLLIIRVLIGISIVASILLFWLPKPVLLLGIGVGMVVMLYLWLVKKNNSKGWFEAAKDIIVPMVYTVATFGIGLIMQKIIPIESYLLTMAFWLVAQQNLFIISYFESFEAEESSSLPIVWGQETTRKILTALLMVILLLCLGAALLTDFHYAARVAFLLACMGGVQHYIVRHQQYWLFENRYRLVIDAVFLLPILA